MCRKIFQSAEYLMHKYLPGITLIIVCIWITQAMAQPADLVVQDTTISTTASFSATNSITAGPNFTIAASGDVTFASDNVIYFRPGINVISGGKFMAINEAIVDALPEVAALPVTYTLQQNYPNPFNPSTIINYELPVTNYVELIIYNVLGQKVTTLVSEKKAAGYHQVEFNAHNLSSGIYYYRWVAGEHNAVKKMVLLR